MDRVAIFVDAGYLFAQGGVALSGSKLPRLRLQLEGRSIVDELRVFAREQAPHCHLLRIYWYDGASSGGRPTSDQTAMANLDDVKLRLGIINSYGQQKGVDALIVTDLIELARLKSISDAILVSGDEDVRVGVQIAQNYGVRVHLLGIKPARGSQSAQLLQEADTTFEWDGHAVRKFMSIRAEEPAPTPVVVERTTVTSTVVTATTMEMSGAGIEEIVGTFVSELQPGDLEAIAKFWESQRGVPSDFDRKLLPRCRNAVGRDLERDEIRTMRARFQELVKQRLSPGSGQAGG